MALQILAQFSVDDILLLIPRRRSIFTLYDQEFLVKTCSLRLQVFKRSLICTGCGIKGSIFRLEKQFNREENPHLNLYAKRFTPEHSDDLVLMTQDHIIPRSKGGADKLENLCTMCIECNVRKGNAYEPLSEK